MATADRTLATREHGASLAPVAHSLQELVPGALVYLDARGNVVSPVRWRWTLGSMLVLWGALGLQALLTAGAVAMAPWLGLSVPLVWMLRTLSRRNRVLRSVMPRIVKGDFAGARAALEAVKPANRQEAALWWQLRAEMLRREGDPAAALVAYQAAVEQLQGATGPRALGVIERCCRYGMVSVLTTLGRLDDAARELGALEAQPRGDFLEYLHWTAELYLAFARGEAPAHDELLWSRARSALELRVGGGLLALCAWAFIEHGDRDMGLHFLATALERMEGEHLDRAAPTLWRWIVAHRDEALAAGA